MACVIQELQSLGKKKRERKNKGTCLKNIPRVHLSDETMEDLCTTC